MMPTTTQINRRTWLKAATLTAAASACGMASAQNAALHGALPSWHKGLLDIHHIDTGRGNAALLVFPDGTTLLIDAGSASGAAGTTAPARPNATISPADAIAHYIQRYAPTAQLDYFLATHIHPDHVSALPALAKRIPVTTVIDRAFPDYPAGKAPLNAPFATEYLDYLRERQHNGQRVEAAHVGSTRQIKPRATVDALQVRILAANGAVWNAAAQQVEDKLVLPAAVAGAQGNENNFSIALHLRYGAFTYFTGGDLAADNHDGRAPELDIESHVVRSAGRVEVAVADHHGYFDACGPAFTNTLDAQAYVIPSWDIGHPGSAQMQRMLGAWESKATHDVFALELLPANALLNRRFASQLKSQQGHVVVRVAPGGATYDIYSLDPTTETSTITGVFGPYRSRS